MTFRLSARVIQTKIHHQTIEPGVKARAAVELLDSREGSQKSFLREIFRLLCIVG